MRLSLVGLVALALYSPLVVAAGAQEPEMIELLNVGAGVGGQAGFAYEFNGVFLGGGRTSYTPLGGDPISQWTFTGGFRSLDGSGTYWQLAWNALGVYDPVDEPPVVLSGVQLLYGLRFGESGASRFGLRLAAGAGCSFQREAREAPTSCPFGGEISLTYRLQ